MAWYYTFEAKEIQRFILQSDKLRDMVGGSELVSRLCDEFLKECLKAQGINTPESVIIANAAGWARIKFEDEQQARNFYATWPLLVSRFAPGIQIIQALIRMDGDLPEAMEAGFRVLREARNLTYPDLPEIGPLVERSPRTGGAAVEFDREREAKVLIDQTTLRKRAYTEGRSLTKKISEDLPHDAWPYELDDIVSGNSAYVAVIHADGNDLGATLMKVKEHLKNNSADAERIYRGFTRAIEEATVAAVRAACEATIFAEYDEKLKKKLAARPIVLGGDDLTIIIRADLALKFTRVFLEAFETGSREILEKYLPLASIKERPEQLTACAGIAFIKKAYPFSAAYQMAESLCDHTKKVAKKYRTESGGLYVPSSFTFHRITTSMAEGFSEAKKQELTGRGIQGKEPLKFWFGPYAVGDLGGTPSRSGEGVVGALPRFADLVKLQKALDKLPTGSIRTLISTMHNDPVSARKDYDRILQVAGKDQGAAFSVALETLTGPEGHPLWNDRNQTPLADAHLLRETLEGGAHAEA